MKGIAFEIRLQAPVVPTTLVAALDTGNGVRGMQGTISVPLSALNEDQAVKLSELMRDQVMEAWRAESMKKKPALRLTGDQMMARDLTGPDTLRFSASSVSQRDNIFRDALKDEE